jgi:putative ABC transport system permease protein
VRAIFDARDEGTITRQMYFHYDYLNEYLKQKLPRAADRAGVFVVEVDDASRAAEISRTIDAEFANSLAETLTETEKAFQLSFVAMVETIIQVIQGVSFIVIVIILAVAANTMAMTARERIGEYATLKALGFGPPFVARLVLAESVTLGAIGGLLAIALTGPVAHGFFESIGKTIFAVFEVAPITYLWQALAALAVGLLAALVPMFRSANIGIVDGLRHVG